MNTQTKNALHRMAAQKFPRQEQVPTARAHPAVLGADERLGQLTRGAETRQPAPRPDTGSWPRRLAPVAAAAAVVLAVGGVGTWWATGSGSTLVEPAASGALGAATTTDGPSPTPAPPTTPGQPPRPTGRYLPPQTPAALEVTLAKILAGTATVRVTDTSSPVAGASAPSQTGAPPAPSPTGGPPAPVPAPDQPKPTPDDGTAVVGTITNLDGTSGGFDLNVAAGAQPDASGCTSDFTDCTITPRPDGSSLAVGLSHDQSAPGGITYEVHLVRPDGANILLHLSNESDPKGQSTVLTDHTPLTITQMTDLVASDQW